MDTTAKENVNNNKLQTTSTESLIGINALAYYIKRICIFIESDKKTISFPNISQQLQNVLVKISVENTEFLSGDEYSDNVKVEALKLAAAMKTKENVKLTHEICDGKLGSNVLTYKKILVNTFKVPESMPLRKPRVVTPASTVLSPSDGSVTQIFKTNCLNAATNFVKDDSQLVMTFPEMVPSQAQFVMDMILPGKECKPKKDIGFGYRSMYAPLWESMRVFSLKYDYKVEYATKPASKDGMKRIIFKKIPKWKPTAIIDLDNEETPGMVIDLDNEDTLDEIYSSSSSSVSLNNSKVYNNSENKVQKNNQPKPGRKIDKLIRKLALRMQKGLIPKTFVCDALRRISEFLFDDQMKRIVFDETSQAEQFFLANVKNLSNNSSTYMLFNSECQKFLDNIRYCTNKRKVQYDIKYGKGVVKAYKDSAKKVSLKSLSFMKITSTASEIIDDDVEATAPVNLNLSSSSAISVSTKSSDSHKPSQCKKPGSEAQKRKLLNCTAQVLVKLSKGNLNEGLIETTLRRISDFMNDQQQASLIFRAASVHLITFLQKVRYLARKEEAYKVFTNESQKLLKNINDCFKRKITYQLRQVKGRKDVILEKPVQFSLNNEKATEDEQQRPNIQSATKRFNNTDRSGFENKSSSRVADSDVEMIELLDSSFSSSTTSLNTIDSGASAKQANAAEINKEAMRELQATMRSGVFSNEFIEKTLQRICDFVYDGKQSNVVFQNMSHDQFRFIKHVDMLAIDVTLHSMFRSLSRKLLSDLHHCLERGTLYRCAANKARNGIDVRLEKLEQIPFKDLKKERENDENIDNTNKSNAPKILSQAEQELLIRLKAIKETIVRTCGNQSIVHYLQDISNFLTQSNTDRLLTFEKLTENEAIFIKHVHMLSKLEAGYAMFSRDCQKLLKSIQLNAQVHKLKFQQINNADKRNMWTVIISKQFLTTNEKKQTMGIDSKHHNSIKSLYQSCRQTLDQKDHIIQQRTRSLSCGRRAQRALNARAERDASCQRERLNVRDKLKAGLAQPVHSDKALRMMECMGWKGGALGLRGEGITEPLALPLDLARRAGLGHVPKPRKQKPESKAKEAKKAKPLKQVPSPATQLPPGYQPVSSLAADVVPPEIMPAGLLGKCKSVVLSKDYHITVLRSILEIITTDIDEMHFVCMKNPIKVIGFLRQAVSSLNGRLRFDLADDAQKHLVAEISHVLDNCRTIALHADIRDKTGLFHPIVVVKKTLLISAAKKKITDEIISLIDEQKTTTEPYKNDQVTTNTNDQDTTSTNTDSTDDQESTTTNVDPAKQSQKQKRSGRPWYSAVESKRQRKTTNTKEQITTKNKVIELKSLALSAVCLQKNIETDIEKTKLNTSDDPNKKEKATELVSTYLLIDQDITEEVNAKKPQETFKSPKDKTTKRSKLIVKVPNMTRKQFATFNHQAKATDIRNERTTYTLDVEQYKINKSNHTDVKVTKRPSEVSSTEAKNKKTSINQERQQSTTKTHVQEKDKDQQTTEIKKTPGMILLEKLIVNNNDSTMNKNNQVSGKKGKLTPKLSVSIRLQNAAADTVTLKKENASINNNAPIVNKDVPVVNKIAPVVNKVTPIVNNVSLIVSNVAPIVKMITPMENNVTPSVANVAPVTTDTVLITSDLSETESICKRTENIKIVEDTTPVMNINAVTQNDGDPVICVIPVDSNITVQTNSKNDMIEIVQNNKNIVPIDNNNDINEKSSVEHSSEINNINKNDICKEDDECEIILDDSQSSIVINSDEEEALLISDDEEIEIPTATNNLTKEKENVASKEVTNKNDISRNVTKEGQETITNGTRNGSGDYFGSGVDIVEKKDSKLSSSQERKRPSPDNPKSVSKKCKLLTDFKKVYILPKDYPQTKMNSEKARKIQAAILKCIDYTQETLPLLKCQGIQNGRLIYSCQDEKSLSFLERLLQIMGNFKIVYEFDVKEHLSHKVAFRMNSYIKDEPVYNILNRLELYNSGLKSTNWGVVEKKQHADFAVIYVKVDEISFNYICEANFVLYAGNDCARFTIVWD